ncbi:MAG: hypothetical protein K0Q81_483 [Paenibacillus sp.]|nr:hypothetical protein [Paenibacillus sp.]
MSWEASKSTEKEIPWFEKPLRILDFIPPGPGQYEKVDIAAEMKHRAELGFNAEHLEVMDIATGASNIFYFRSGEAVEQRKDLLETYTQECRRNNIHSFVYVNVHWAADNVVTLYPEWVERNPDGSIIPISYGVGAYHCVNSSFKESTVRVVQDLAQYDIDGIFLDGPIFNEKGCFWSACTSKFKPLYGYELTDEVFTDRKKFIDYIQFKKDSIAEFVRDCYVALKEANENMVLYMNSVGLNPNKHCSRDNNLTIRYQDILGAEGGFLGGNLTQLPIFKPGLSAKLLETQADGKPTVIFIAGRMGGGWNRMLLSPVETEIVHAESAANGASTWYGVYIENSYDPRMQTVQNLYRFLEDNEAYFTKTQSAARIAMVWSYATGNYYHSSSEETDFTAAKGRVEADEKSDARASLVGWYDMLKRNQIVFDLIDDYYTEHKDLSKYEVLILPNISCMSDQQIHKIKQFVENGGKLITTFDTSMYDELGVRREKLGLQDVLGIEQVVRKELLKKDHIQVESEDVYLKQIDDSFIPAPYYSMYVEPAAHAESHLSYREKMKSVYADVPDALPYPVVIKNQYGQGQSLYVAGTIGQMYHDFHLIPFKRMAANLIDDLTSRDVIIEAEVDSVNIELRVKGNQLLLHMINYTGGMSRPIDSIVKLRNVGIRMLRQVRSAKSLRTGVELAVTNEAAGSSFVLPELGVYDVIVMDMI